MAFLRKRPIIIEAVQWTGDNYEELVRFAGQNVAHIKGGLVVYDKLHDSWIKVSETQWIVQGIQGEFYPLDDQVKQDSYDEVAGWNG